MSRETDKEDCFCECDECANGNCAECDPATCTDPEHCQHDDDEDDEDDQDEEEEKKESMNSLKNEERTLLAKIEAKAEKLRGADPSLSHAQAVASVLRTSPQLYDRYAAIHERLSSLGIRGDLLPEDR